MGKREYWIDYAKVILIYLVIVAHSGHISAMADSYICSFHMPAFLVISGLLYKPSDNILQSVKKNVKRLLVPALFFSVLCAVYNGLRLYKQSDLTIETGLIQPFYGLFFYDRVIGFPACGVMWFVVVLFMSKLTLDVLFRYFREWTVALFVCIVAFCASFIQEGNFTYFYYLERWMVCLPLVYIGYVMKKYQLFQRMAESKFRYLIIGGGILIHACLFQMNGRVGIHSFVFGNSLWVFYFIALVQSTCVFLLAKVALSTYRSNLVEWLSKNTLTILGLHRVLLEVTSRLIHEGFAQSILTLLCLMPIIWVLNKFCPVLIGNKK